MGAASVSAGLRPTSNRPGRRFVDADPRRFPSYPSVIVTFSSVTGSVGTDGSPVGPGRVGVLPI